MLEIKGDLFEVGQNLDADAICITTNGFVTARLDNVMGKGCAGEAKKRWPGIEAIAGRMIRSGQNRCHILTTTAKSTDPAPLLRIPIKQEIVFTPYHIVSFPTKPAFVKDPQDFLPYYRVQIATRSVGPANMEPAPGWMAKSNLELIEKSARELVEISGYMDWDKVILPRPGCGAGELSWENEVRPILASILDDRFSAITFK